MNEMKIIDQKVTDKYAIYNGDSCEFMTTIPDNTIHFGIHSPPFEGLYKFTNSPRDISNSEGEDFWNHYKVISDELFRITKPGRLHSVHVMQLPATKTRDGFIGMRDFRGDVIRLYQKSGWIMHSEVCIWKDPATAQQRTKSIRLLHKQLCKDSTISGQGLADYVVTFRKPGENDEPVDGMFDSYAGEDFDFSREGYEKEAKFLESHGKPAWPYDKWLSIMTWRRYASPVWTDIRQTRTLQYRGGREEKDEQHISPLQLDVIERCIDLWSNEGDIVFTPFMGIGSEVYVAVEKNRKGIGCELKESYFKQAVKNISELEERIRQENNMMELFQ